jgi:uncharacterized protein YbaP (TraB family)
MKARKHLAGLAIVAALFAPAAAQDLGGDVTIVEELIVRPFVPGPAWWRVSDEDSAIFVMVVPDYAPADLDWGREELEFRLQGANRLILPPEMALGPISVTQAVFMAANFISGKDLNERLSPGVYEKLVAAGERVGFPTDDYDRLPIDIVAVGLSEDHLEYSGLQYQAMLDAFEATASAQRVRRIRAANLPGRQVMALVDKNLQVGEPCLEAMIDGLDARAAALLAIAESWALGDVRPLVDPAAEAELPQACQTSLMRVEEGRRLEERLLADQTATFERVLRMKGHSVAVLEPWVAFGENGVLERLRAKGYVIFTPADQD